MKATGVPIILFVLKLYCYLAGMSPRHVTAALSQIDWSALDTNLNPPPSPLSTQLGMTLPFHSQSHSPLLSHLPYQFCGGLLCCHYLQKCAQDGQWQCAAHVAEIHFTTAELCSIVLNPCTCQHFLVRDGGQGMNERII